MRPKSTNRDLPPRMIRVRKQLVSGKTWESFYYNGRVNGKRVKIPLGNDLNEAKRKWAELECREAPPETGLMAPIFSRYEREVIPKKAPKTQLGNLSELAMLRKVFDAAPIDAITPQHVAQYRDKRGAAAPVRANRELALLSHVFNLAREWGYTAKENPCRGVRKNRETPRDYYADDAVWSAVYQAACDELRDAMDLAYLSGQRPADVLKMRFSDIKDGALEVEQNKTKRKLRIVLAGTQLGAVIERIRARKVSSVYLIATASGVPLKKHTLRVRFDNARLKAQKVADEALASRIQAFQFRDIRPKAASETDLEHASKLLGHTEHEITQKVYRRVGETVKPVR